VPPLIAAVVVAALIVLVEVGAAIAERLLGPKDTPGLGIPYLVLVDGTLLFTLILIAASLIVPEPITGRFQGCVTAILAILVILAGIVLIIAAIALLLLMIGLIMSFFGAIVYLAVFGDFPRAEAAVTLSLLLTMKVIVAVLLVLAHQRFITNKGLVLLVISSLVANIIVSFLHALVPILLVSITDAIAAIIVGIIGVIWAVILLIGGIIAIIRALQPPAIGGEEAIAAGEDGMPVTARP
jgi:hypothetical protein